LEPSQAQSRWDTSAERCLVVKEPIFIMSSIAVFAVIGMLTGYLHGHGEIAGTICGGLGGLMLAVVVPLICETPFLSKHRYLQFFIAAIALVPLSSIVCWMYDAWGIRSLIIRLMSIDR